jgi:heterodisulfide reductase subunit A-like polyferredoxin
MAEMLGVVVDMFGFYNLDDAEVAPVQSSVPRVFLAGTGLGPGIYRRRLSRCLKQ